MLLNPLAIAVLFTWPFAMGVLTFFFPVRRIILISIIAGNLFLPQARISIPGFPNYTKPLAAGLGALIAALILAAPQLFAYRPKFVDLFFFTFLAAPGISSFMNGLGNWDTASATVNRFLEWGAAYLLGRAFFTNRIALRDLAIAFVFAGIIYAPLCLWEEIMSPQLSMKIYGFRPSAFGMTMRMGGYRPMVFMQHGLALAAWMASSALVAWILWRSKSITRIWSIPMSWIAIGLVLVTISLRSTGAAILLLGLIAAVEFVHTTRLKIALLILILMPTGYITIRTLGWEGQELVQWSSFLGEERAGSLNMRLENDTIIVRRAMQKPAFGWGGWGGWRVRDDTGRDITVSDSWWPILLGTTGMLGLIGAYGTFLAPLFILIRKKTHQNIFEGAQGAAWAIGLALLLFILDSLANAMPNTSFMLAAGALTSFVLNKNMNSSQRPANPELDTQTQPPQRRPVDLR